MCGIHSFNQRSVLSVSTLSLNVALCLTTTLFTQHFLIILLHFLHSVQSVKRFNMQNVMDAYESSGVSFISMFWKNKSCISCSTKMMLSLKEYVEINEPKTTSINIIMLYVKSYKFIRLLKLESHIIFLVRCRSLAVLCPGWLITVE